MICKKCGETMIIDKYVDSGYLILAHCPKCGYRTHPEYDNIRNNIKKTETAEELFKNLGFDKETLITKDSIHIKYIKSKLELSGCDNGRYAQITFVHNKSDNYLKVTAIERFKDFSYDNSFNYNIGDITDISALLYPITKQISEFGFDIKDVYFKAVKESNNNE